MALPRAAVLPRLCRERAGLALKALLLTLAAAGEHAAEIPGDELPALLELVRGQIESARSSTQYHRGPTRRRCSERKGCRQNLLPVAEGAPDA